MGDSWFIWACSCGDTIGRAPRDPDAAAGQEPLPCFLCGARPERIEVVRAPAEEKGDG